MDRAWEQAPMPGGTGHEAALPRQKQCRYLNSDQPEKVLLGYLVEFGPRKALCRVRSLPSHAVHARNVSGVFGMLISSAKIDWHNYTLNVHYMGFNDALI